MTSAHTFYRLYALVICDHAPAQRNVEDFDFVSAVPHSNHRTVGTAGWQNHDSPSPQSVIILHCHVCLGLSNPYFPSALWRQCKSRKTQHIYQAMDIPVLLRGWGETAVTNDWNIICSLWGTLYWPQTQNITSADIFFNLIPSTFPPNH